MLLFCARCVSPFKVKPKNNYGSELRLRAANFWGIEWEVFENGLPVGRKKINQMSLRGREFECALEDITQKQPFFSTQLGTARARRSVLTEKMQKVLYAEWVGIPEQIKFNAGSSKYQLVSELFGPDLLYKNGVLIGEIANNRLSISAEEPPEVKVFLYFLFGQYWGPTTMGRNGMLALCLYRGFRLLVAPNPFGPKPTPPA